MSGLYILGGILGLGIIFLIEIVYTAFLNSVSNSKSVLSPLFIPSGFNGQFAWFLATTKNLFSKTNLVLLIIGIYISTIGLFFNLCEIFYIKRKMKIRSEDAFLISTRESIKNTGNVLFNLYVYPILVVLFIVIGLGGRGCDRLTAVYFYNHNKKLFDQSFITYFKEGLLFQIKVISCLIFNIVAFIVLIFSPIIIVRLLWTFGFWASISVLVLFSKQIATLFHIKIEVPIFSIILTFLGMVISIVGYLL